MARLGTWLFGLAILLVLSGFGLTAGRDDDNYNYSLLLHFGGGSGNFDCCVHHTVANSARSINDTPTDITDTSCNITKRSARATNCLANTTKEVADPLK